MNEVRIGFASSREETRKHRRVAHERKGKRLSQRGKEWIGKG
jgi:hypothetical protein